jgi:hypothetical protein
MAPLLQKLCAFIVVLAIAVSLTGGAGAWAMSGDMATAAGMADGTSPICDEGDCPDHTMADATCYATCSGTLAVLSSSTASHHWADQDFYPSTMPAHIGQTSPPDPSPPRFSVLS